MIGHIQKSSYKKILGIPFFHNPPPNVTRNHSRISQTVYKKGWKEPGLFMHQIQVFSLKEQHKNYLVPSRWGRGTEKENA